MPGILIVMPLNPPMVICAEEFTDTSCAGHQINQCIIVALPILIISGYLAQSGLKIVFREKRSKLMVIQTGVFSLVRHPIYLGSILLYLGFIILSMSVIAFGIWIMIIVFYVYIFRYEENILIDKLGEEYE